MPAQLSVLRIAPYKNLSNLPLHTASKISSPAACRLLNMPYSLNVMPFSANLDDIKKLEGDSIQDCDGSFGLSHVDEVPSLVIQSDCCHHAVIGCWLAVLALSLCRHKQAVTVMQQHQGMGKSACTMPADAHSVCGLRLSLH